MTQIVVPTLGESVSEATVAKWLKKEGESVKADEPLVELETDKVTLEVNAPASGVVSRIVASAGSNVGVGALLGEITAGGVANDAAKPAAKAEQAAAPTPVPAKPAAPAAPAAATQHSPAVRKLLGDTGVETAGLSGTGKDGRLTKGDVLQALNNSSQANTQSGPREERVKMTRLRQRIAQRLKEAQNTAAMLTTFNEVDMTAINELRGAYKDNFEKKHGIKLGFMSFFVKAAVNALREFPAVNAEIDGDEIVYKNYYDISVAVSTPTGLVVPVVRNCDSKSMAQIEGDIAALGARARDGKLEMDDMMGGTFTITNGGVFGSLMSTPILNAPQTAILGMHKVQQRPMVMPDGTIKARPMMYIAMSYDHRLIDGREAVGFVVRIKEALEDPQRLLLDI
ncbi:MAG: 2-oxoglutarate dehydrogenase complex dihydrolipoyllysine-residue succinyltransferase [Pseudomonadota bacterium]